MEIVFEGACPFLTCLLMGSHTHPVCPECGAVNYGNFTCPTCTGKQGKAYRREYYGRYLGEVRRMAGLNEKAD